MKKFLLVLLLLLTFAFASCGNKDNSGSQTDNGSSSQQGGSETRKTDDAIADTYKALAKDKKVYVTTCGQADDDIVVSILGVAGVESSAYTQNKALTASAVEDGSVVFLVVGSSSKGLGSAGVSVDAETARAEAFVSAAKANKITIVLFHVGGTARRGSLSDPVIKAAMPGAKLALVVESGNSDGLFTTEAASSSVDLYQFSKSSKMVPSVKVLFDLA